MNIKEYNEHMDAMRAFYEREELGVMVDIDAEPYFSWSPCECCGSHLGGDRYDMRGFSRVLPDAPQFDYSICVDCYLAVNGVLEVG